MTDDREQRYRNVGTKRKSRQGVTSKSQDEVFVCVIPANAGIQKIKNLDHGVPVFTGTGSVRDDGKIKKSLDN